LRLTLYVCILKTHQTHTFLRVCGAGFRVKHCVLTLFDEQSLLRSSDRFKFKVFLQVSSLARATSLRGV
jgi:hypothetical protein